MSERREEGRPQPSQIQPQPRQAKRNVVQLAKLDLLEVLARFLLKAREGTPLTFTTFKETWKQLSFSHIFEACPTKSRLPVFITCLYEYLLDIIKSGTFPDQITELVVQDSGGNSTGLLPGDVAFISTPIMQGLPVVTSAVYGLYCLYYVQPGPILVRIRVGREHQDAVMGLAPYFAQASILDALLLLRRLLEDKAFLPGSPHNPVEDIDSLGGEDAATLREVRFHLDSTLSGLGTAHLDPLCRGYGEKLGALWTVLENGDGQGSAAIPAPEGIADLSLGMWLHEYAVDKNKEVHLVLKHSSNWRAKKKRRKRGSRTETAATAAGGSAQPSTSAGGTAPTLSLPSGASTQARQRRGAGEGMVEEVAGVPRVARQLLAREQARKADIARRSQPWATLMGVDIAGTGHMGPGADGFVSDEDMPVIPGVESVHAYLAGKSEAGTSAALSDGSSSDRDTRELTIEQRRKGLGLGTRYASSSDSGTSDGYESDGLEEAISPVPRVNPQVAMKQSSGRGGRGVGNASTAGAAGRGKKGRVRWKDDGEAGGSGVRPSTSRGGGKKLSRVGGGGGAGRGRGQVQRPPASRDIHADRSQAGTSTTAGEAPMGSPLGDVQALLAEINSALDEDERIKF